MSPSLPDDWPADVLAYPDARIIRVSQGEAGSELVLETPDSTADVFEFYDGTLGYAGWSVERGVEGPGDAMRFAADHVRTARAILCILTPLASGSRIELMMAKGAPAVPTKAPGGPGKGRRR